MWKVTPEFGYLLHVLGQEMNFLTIFIGNNWTFGGPCISAKNNAILENDSHNCCSRFNRFRWSETIVSHHFIAKSLRPCRNTRKPIVEIVDGWGYVAIQSIWQCNFWTNILIAASVQTYRRQFSKLNPLFGYSAAILPASNASTEIILIRLNNINQRNWTKCYELTQSTNTSKTMPFWSSVFAHCRRKMSNHLSWIANVGPTTWWINETHHQLSTNSSITKCHSANH